MTHRPSPLLWLSHTVTDYTGHPPSRIRLAIAGLILATGLLTQDDPVTTIVIAVLAPGLVALALIDADIRRLPDRILLPLYPLAAAVLIPAGIWTNAPEALLRAAATSAAALLGYAILCAATGAIGFGDVKLAGLLGLITGWVGWSATLLATTAAMLLGAIHGLIVLSRNRSNRTIPYGPHLITTLLLI